MAEQLLYEVVLHGVGWRLEQEESADMVLGWRTRRELHEGDDVDADAPRSAIEENSAGQIVAALQQRDARALLRHLLPHRLVALSLWLLRDGATILAQLEGRRRMAGLVHALERRHAQLPEWQLALCHGGEILAIWRTEELVVLSSRDNFASPVALWAAPADSKPHCRLLAWSPDDSLLAAATSDGTVHVLDARARLLHRLPPVGWGLLAAHGSLSGAEVGHAITGIAFRSSRQREGGDAALVWELLLLSCDAVLHRISIPSAAATTVHGTTPSRSTAPPVLLGAHHGMVSCMSYDQNHGLLAVGGGGGCASLQASLLRAKQDPASPPLALPSLSIWALRDRPPFSSLIFTTTTNASSAVPVAAAMRRLWMRAHAVLRGTGVPSAVSFCPSGERLSVLTLEGQLTVWDTEPLVTASRAEVTLSSGMPELPLVLSEGEPLDKCIMCTGWWDDSSIILATRLGAVSICRLPQLQNLLGAPHPFAAGSALSTAQNNSLFVLEREIQPIAEQERAAAATTHPQRRVQSWRLISLRQTSPEVLFERKVALREYEAALQWAHLYGMSEDPVRQAQWRESEVTAASINNYLAKVTSLRWVLDECCHRVPPDPHDLELLLNFGRDRAKATLRSTGEGSAPPQENDLSRVEIEEFIQRLARYSTRLKTSLRLSEAEGRTGFDVEAFVMLRDVAMSDFAHEMAAQERFSTLEVLIKSHKEELDHLRLDLLRSVPETTSPSNYAFLIAPIAAEALQAHSGAAAGSRSIDAASLCEWFCSRAREIDERSGALDNAEELLQLAVSLGLGAHVRQMLATVQLLSSLVYRLDCTASLAEFESFSEQQRIALLFSLAPPWAGERANHAFHDFCRQHVKPFLRLQRRGPRLLREYAIRLAAEDSPHALHLCAALVHLSGHERPVEERLLRPQSLLIDTALRCIYGSPRADDEALELMTAMYKALPGRDVALSTAEDESDEEEADEENSEARDEESSSAPGHSQLPLLLDQLDALEQHLSAQYELRDYGMLQRMSDYLQGERGLDAERGHKLLRAMARHTGRRSPPASSGVWLQTRDDMVQLRDQACSQLPSELAYCEWLQALLLAAEFRLAADFLRAQTSSTPLLGMDTAERLVLMAAREYFNSAPSSADSSVEHAEKCLRVLPLASGEVEAELNLVKAVRLLATFGCDLLPLQVRMLPDRRKLVVELVRNCSAATARLADFEQLAEALGLKSGSDRAAIAEAVAWKALDEGDQRCAVQLALQLVSERHGSSWSLCDLLLTRCGDALSASSPEGGAPSGERADVPLEPRTRQKLLSHALAHCDPDRFEPLMQLWRDWRDEQTTASLRAQADSLSMHSSEESMAAMKSVAALHQDYQTLHEIKKAISDGLTFREWMQLNESADVTADGFTERVNSNDFRARYWAEAGGIFSPSEQAHLSSTRAADPPADDPERVRLRHMFNRTPVAAQASQIEETEATLKAVIGCVTGEEQSENMDATLEPAAARRALLRSRLLLIEAQPRPCSDAVKQVERSIRIELFRGCLRRKLAALAQAAADGNLDAFEEPSGGSISADENAINRQAIIDLSLESEPEIALALSSEMWDESTIELTVTTLWRRIRAAAGTGAVDSVRSTSEMGAWACARMAIVLRDPSKEAAERLRRAESLAELLPLVIRDGKLPEGIVGLLHSHLDGFLEVLRELETAERLAATLPEIDCAQFATDRSARTRACVELACTQVDGALQDAFEIARRVGMDEWELRMACVRAALVERNEGGAPADLSAWRSRLRDTLAQHDQHLLQHPTRLSRALVLDVLPAVAAHPVPMDAVMQLMLEGEKKQRADQKVSAERSTVSSTLLNHNLLLLLSVRAAFRYLRKAAASIDPRDLLRLGCDFEADGFIKLSLGAAPQAASTLEANVNEETTTRLALLMPELSACISQGGGGGAKLDPFTTSFVWLAYARRTLLLERGDAMERTVALLPRLSTEHLAELLLPLEPVLQDLPDGRVPKSGRLALHDLGILLRETQALLRARAFAKLVQRKLRATEELHVVEVASWRQVKRRRRKLQSFEALARRRTEGTAFSELLLLWAEVNREDKWDCEDEEGRPDTFDVLLKYLTSAFGSASQTLEALKIVLPCSSDDTEGRGAMPRLLEMGAQRVLWVLEGNSGCMLNSGSWIPDDTDAAILAMRRILEVGAAAGEAPPTSFLDVVRNEHLNEELRIQMVELLSASWRQLGMDASPDAAATNALKLRLHARRTVASVYPERDDLVEQVSQLPLNTDSGAAAASKLLTSALEDESDTTKARIRVSAHADLMLEWADNLICCQQAGTLLPESSKTPSSLHSEWLSLYCAALKHGGPELLLDVRYTVWNVTRMPMLFETEEQQLVSAIRTHAPHPDADGPDTLELACIACFLLSGWSSLEQKALCLLSGEYAAVEPDARLARLLVRQDRLPAIACTSYWETLLPTLGKAQDTVAMAVVSLGKSSLFLEAGSVLLNHFRCHPVMISAGAKLAMLSEYVATHCDFEADPSLASEMRKIASELATLQRQPD